MIAKSGLKDKKRKYNKAINIAVKEKPDAFYEVLQKIHYKRDIPSITEMTDAYTNT